MATETELLRIRRIINDATEPFVYSDEELDARFAEDNSNFNLLAYHIWVEKAASYSTMVDTSESGSSRANSDLYNNAVKQANFYKTLADEGVVEAEAEVAPFTVAVERP